MTPRAVTTTATLRSAPRAATADSYVRPVLELILAR